MLLGEFIDRLGRRLKLDPDATDERQVKYRTRFSEKISESYKEVSNAYPWQVLRRFSDFITIPNYTTGTASWTNNSHVVTGIGNTFTTAMAGRYFKPQTGYNWYKIVYIDNINNQLILEKPMIEATSSGTFTIWKRFYYLTSEVKSIIDFGSWVRNGILVDKGEREIPDITSNISNTGQPQFFSMYGVSPFEDTYSTGTVTIPKDSNVLTGVGTSFLDNAGAGDILTIANSKTKLRVKRVETDLRAILQNYSTSDYSSAQTFLVEKDNPIGFQLYFNPDSQYIFPYSFQKRVFDLVHESKDRPELPEIFDLAILDGSETAMLREMKDTNWGSKFQEYAGRIADLRRTQNTSIPRTRSLYPIINSRRGY